MSINSKSLAGKTALITGGSSGIGFATAKLFVESGAKVFITGRDIGALRTASESLGSNVEIIQADSSNMHDIQKTRRIIQEKAGKLDILFYNAGVAKFASFMDTTEEMYDANFDINTKGAFFTVQALSPLLADGASVILNSTFLIFKGFPGAAAYTASKAALASLGKTFAAELADRNVRVNVINTGPTETPIYGKTGLPADVVTQIAGQIVAAVPMKRFGTADEIAHAVRFLASDESAFMLGSQITVDGGFSQV